MTKFPYRLIYRWDGKRAGYYAVVEITMTGEIIYTTRTYRTRKDAREDVEKRITEHTLIGA